MREIIYRPKWFHRNALLMFVMMDARSQKSITMSCATVLLFGLQYIHQQELFHHSQFKVEPPGMVNLFTSVIMTIIHFDYYKNCYMWIMISGRAHHRGSLTIGKVQISHGALYIPFDGSEVPIHSEIEVLTEPWTNCGNLFLAVHIDLKQPSKNSNEAVDCSQ